MLKNHRIVQGANRSYPTETRKPGRGKHNTEHVLEHDVPKLSMYGISTYIWLKSMVHVGKYSMHGAFGVLLLHVFGGVTDSEGEVRDYACYFKFRYCTMVGLFGSQ